MPAQSCESESAPRSIIPLFLWGAPGLLLAIPLTAGIKAVCDNVKGLRAFGKFLGD
jgi:predicted PurR-regulated permease PerM